MRIFLAVCAIFAPLVLGLWTGCTVDDLPPYDHTKAFVQPLPDGALRDQGQVAADLSAPSDRGQPADTTPPPADVGRPLGVPLLVGNWLQHDLIRNCTDEVSWAEYTVGGGYTEALVDGNACYEDERNTYVCQGGVGVTPLASDPQGRLGRLNASCSGTSRGGQIEAKTMDIPYYIFALKRQGREDALGLSHHIFSAQDAFTFQQTRLIRYAPSAGKPALNSEVVTTLSFTLDDLKGSWQAENFRQLDTIFKDNGGEQLSVIWQARIKARVTLALTTEELDQALSVPATLNLNQDGLLVLQAQRSWESALEEQGIVKDYTYMAGVLGALLRDTLYLDPKDPRAWYALEGTVKMSATPCEQYGRRFPGRFEGLCD